MGLRGPLANTVSYQAPAPVDLTSPEWLCSVGSEYWNRHAKHLASNNLLTTATADSFALLCDLWARLQAFRDQPTTRSYLDTAKAFSALAKVFRAVPCDKPGAAVEHRHQDKPGFNF
jgi:phage terminase small subunit